MGDLVTGKARALQLWKATAQVNKKKLACRKLALPCSYGHEYCKL